MIVSVDAFVGRVESFTKFHFNNVKKIPTLLHKGLEEVKMRTSTRWKSEVAHKVNFMRKEKILIVRCHPTWW